MRGVSRVFVFGSHGAARLSSVFTVRKEKLHLQRLFEPLLSQWLKCASPDLTYHS